MALLVTLLCCLARCIEIVDDVTSSTESALGIASALPQLAVFNETGFVAGPATGVHSGPSAAPLASDHVRLAVDTVVAQFALNASGQHTQHSFHSY